MPWSIQKRDDEFCVIKQEDNSVEGCHATREKAEEQVKALYAAEDDASLAQALRVLIGRNFNVEAAEEDPPATGEDYAVEADIEVPAPTHFPWEGPITYEGVFTGDRRLFREGSVVWNEDLLPFPFKWQRVSSEGHDASITIGRVDTIERREDGEFYGTGVILGGPDAPEEAAQYLVLLKEGAAGGVSIDGDDAEFEILGETPEDLRMEFSRINIRALTAVDIPAFANAKIQLSDSFVAAVIGSTDLPMASRDRRWDGLAAQRSIWAWAEQEDGSFDTSKLNRAFLWRDSNGDPQNKGSYKLPFTEVIDGTLTAVPKAVFAAAAAIEGARGGVNIPDNEKPGVRRKLATLYTKIPAGGEDNTKPTPPWETDDEEASLRRKSVIRQRWSQGEIESIVASAIPVDPPVEWFANPRLTELTPITISDEGQIVGHLAGWDSCHIGFGSCKTAPSGCDYDNYFHVGALKTEDGNEISVGHMTFGGGPCAS